MSNNNYLSILLVSGSGIIAGGLNYIYHLVMLNFLTIEEFGTLGSLVGIFNLLTVITIGIILFLNKELSTNIKNKGRVKHIFIESTKILFILGLILYFIFLAFSSFIGNFIKVDDPLLVYLVGISIITSFLGASINSTLRSIKKFNFLATYTIVAPLIKLILGFLLVYLGFNIYGAIIGLVVGGAFGIIIGLPYLIKYFKQFTIMGTSKELFLDILNQKKSIIHFFFISLFFTIFMNIDVILAKNIFDDTTAGFYSGVSILGKFLIFLLLSVETVYYGQIMEYNDKKPPRNLIYTPILIILFISIAAYIFNLFFGSALLQLLKSELTSYNEIYLLSLIFYGELAIISFYTKVLVGWGKYYVNYIMGTITVLLFIGVYEFGTQSLENFINVFIYISFFCLVILTGLFFYEYKKKEA